MRLARDQNIALLTDRVMEHCMEIFYDLWSLFGDTKTQTH
jgi:hypothetical protein